LDQVSAPRATWNELLAVLKAAIGDLGGVRRIVKLFVMGQTAHPHVTEPHRVRMGRLNSCSRFGERASIRAAAVSVGTATIWRFARNRHDRRALRRHSLDHTRVPGREEAVLGAACAPAATKHAQHVICGRNARIRERAHVILRMIKVKKSRPTFLQACLYPTNRGITILPTSRLLLLVLPRPLAAHNAGSRVESLPFPIDCSRS